MSSEQPTASLLGPLLDYLRSSRGVDLTGYRTPTLLRRITKRLQEVQIGSVSEYIDHLEVHPEEFLRLFDIILINVTSFFRDPETWDALARRIIPAIVADKPKNEPIRVWSAGCASGEEAFTLAMLWCENVGIEQFRKRVKIYATDVDENALASARQGTYDSAQIEAVPDELRSRYFEGSGTRHAFRHDLRRAIIFGRHDLIQDAPISRLDLLVCRNTLIYLNAETQTRILARFHFAINPAGLLFLGKAEMLLTHANLFHAVDMKHRIFAKAAQVDVRDRLFALAQTGDQEAANRLAKTVRLGEEVLTTMPIAQIALDADGVLVLANQLARSSFAVSAQDLGRPLRDLEISYRPLPLLPLVQRVQVERASVRVEGVEWALPGGAVQLLDVQVVPLLDDRGSLLGVSVVFDDTTRARQLQSDLQRTTQELETSYEELQSTNEELVTTNEELQSTVEELQTTNEELQATNEEHQTMNEELQSTNEELETINDQLRGRTEDLNQANVLLEAILGGLGPGVAVVDRELTVLAWNSKMEDLWGLRLDEVRGRSLAQIEFGLPFSELREPLNACLNGSAGARELTVEAITRRGRTITCRVSLTPLVSADRVKGAIISMEEEPS